MIISKKTLIFLTCRYYRLLRLSFRLLFYIFEYNVYSFFKSSETFNTKHQIFLVKKPPYSEYRQVFSVNNTIGYCMMKYQFIMDKRKVQNTISKSTFVSWSRFTKFIMNAMKNSRGFFIFRSLALSYSFVFPYWDLFFVSAKQTFDRDIIPALSLPSLLCKTFNNIIQDKLRIPNTFYTQFRENNEIFLFFKIYSRFKQKLTKRKVF